MCFESRIQITCAYFKLLDLQVVPHVTAVSREDFHTDVLKVEAEYYREIAAAVKCATGADEVMLSVVKA